MRTSVERAENLFDELRAGSATVRRANSDVASPGLQDEVRKSEFEVDSWPVGLRKN